MKKIKRDERYKELSKLDQMIYLQEITKCELCSGFKDCEQDLKGVMRKIITSEFGGLKKTKSILVSCPYVPKKIKGSYKSKILNADKGILSETQKKASKFMYDNRGGYLFGSAGHGKTTIMTVLAKAKHNQQKEILFELANNVSVNLKSFEDTKEKMRMYQEVEVLFIDDFAREVLSEWVILNIWSPILQHRIDNNLETYVSGNYPLGELFSRISDKTDNITADTIVGRFKEIGTYELKDQNYRLKVK